MRISLSLFVACLLLFVGSTSSGAAPLKVYFVGNSLTWDANPIDLKAAAATQGQSMTIGYHIQCGQGLQTIVASPTTCVPPPAEFGNATIGLNNHPWDVISLQPYNDTLVGGQQAAQALINRARSNAANANTRFLIYAAYPGGSDPNPAGPPQSASPGEVKINFRDVWQKKYSDSDRFNADYFTQLITALRNDPANAGLAIDMVPMGDVLAELDARLAEKPVGVIDSVEKLYRDANHLGYAGKYAGMATFYSVLNKQSPENLPLTQSEDPASIQLASLIQDTVWDVVSTHSYSGVPEPTTLLGTVALGGLLLRRYRVVK